MLSRISGRSSVTASISVNLSDRKPGAIPSTKLRQGTSSGFGFAPGLPCREPCRVSLYLSFEVRRPLGCCLCGPVLYCSANCLAYCSSASSWLSFVDVGGWGCWDGRGGLAGGAGSGSLCESGSLMPSSALKAGSTSPRLAVRTARMTPESMVGNASLNVSSACSRDDIGRGGFDGGASSLGGGLGRSALAVSTVPVSWSLSKSRGRAVVGDSGGPSEGFNGETGDG